MTDKAALEEIWNRRGVAWAIRPAGWLTEEMARRANVGFWKGNGRFVRVRCPRR